MAMIGAPPRELWSALNQGIPTAPQGAPAPNLDTPQYQPPPTMAAAAPAKPKFNWLGVLADALSGAAGQPGQFAASMRQQQAEQTAFERGEQQYRTHRQDSNDDWMRRQQYEDAHRAPDELTRMMDAANIPADQRPGMYSQAVQRKLNPPRIQVLADGSVIELPSGSEPLVPHTPSAPVGNLTPINGGPGSPAPATFQR